MMAVKPNEALGIRPRAYWALLLALFIPGRLSYFVMRHTQLGASISYRFVCGFSLTFPKVV